MPRTAGLTLQLNNYKAFGGQLKTLDRALGDIDKRVDKAGDAFDKLERDLDGTNRSMVQVEQRSSRLKGALRGLSSGALAMGAAISGPLALLRGAALSAAVEFEDAFAGVVKTLDTTGLTAVQTSEFLAELSQDLRDLATSADSPVSSLENAHIELSRIAELGGQLGIARDDLLGFTETIGMLTMATDLSADSAAMMTAQFANILQTSEFGRIGDVIVELGNNMATTESQILEFGQRLAGAGGTAGMTEAQILALGAAMASVGINAEAGGSAMTRVINEMTTAVATGNDHLAVFAELAGQTTEEFAETFRNEPIVAIQEFIDALGQLGNEEQVLALDSLSLDGLRVADTLRRMAGAEGLLTDAVDMANLAWEEQTALMTEAEKRAETTKSQMNFLKNNLNDVAITIGNELLPGLNNTISRLVPFLQTLADTNPELIRMAIKIGSVLTVLPPLVFGLSQVGLALGSIVAIVPLLGGIGVIFAGLALVVSQFGDQIADAFAEVRGFVEFAGTAMGFLPSQTTVGTADLQRQNELLERRTGIMNRLYLMEMEQAENMLRIDEHRIEAGDTLWDLAQEYNTTVEELRRLNPDLDPNLPIGTMLTIDSQVDIDTEASQRQIDELNAELEELDQTLEEMGPPPHLVDFVDRFAETGLFSVLFGDDVGAIDRARETFTLMSDKAAEFSVHIEDIRVGFSNIFADDFEASGESVQRGLDLIKNGLASFIEGDYAKSVSELGGAIDQFKLALTQLFSEDVEGSLNRIRTGLDGLIETAADLMNIWGGRNMGDVWAIGDDLTTVPQRGAEQLGGGGFVDMIGNQLRAVAEFDFSELEQAIADNLASIIRGAVSLAGIVLGGPVGMGLGFVNIVLMAIENDFLGIGTALEKTGILQTIRDAVTVVSDAIEGIFMTETGEFDSEAGQQWVDLLDNIRIVFSSIGSALASLFGPAVSSILEGIVTDIIPGILDIANGISEFFAILAGKEGEGTAQDAEDAESAIATLGRVLGVIADLGVSIVGGALSGIGDALPIIADSIVMFIQAIGELGEGDVDSFIRLVHEGFGNLAGALLAIPAGIADSLIEMLEGLFGIEMLDVSQVVDLIETGWNIISIVIDRIVRELSSKIVDFQVMIVTQIAELEELLGGVSDPTRGQLETLITQQQATAQADAFTDALQQQINANMLDFDMHIPVESFTPGMEGVDAGGAMMQFLRTPHVIDAMGTEARLAIEDALALMASEGITPPEELLAAASEIGAMIPDSIVSSMAERQEELNAAAEASIAEVTETISSFLDTISEGEETTFGSKIPDGLILGIEEGQEDLNQAFIDAANEGLNSMRDAFATHSPSQVTASIGIDVLAGLGAGMMQGIHYLDSPLAAAVSRFVLITNAGKRMENQLTQSWAHITAAIVRATDAMREFLSLSGGGANVPGGGRQFGGSVEGRQHGGGVYRFGEGGNHEIFSTRSGRNYLLPGEGGHVYPGRVSEVQAVGGGAPMISYNVDSISIHPNAGDTVTPELIAEGLQLHAEMYPPQRRMRSRL